MPNLPPLGSTTSTASATSATASTASSTSISPTVSTSTPAPSVVVDRFDAKGPKADALPSSSARRGTSAVDVRLWSERPYRAKRVTEKAVDAAAVEHNVRLLREKVGTSTEICAVVKANAYGHGAVEVATLALRAGATRLAVATVEEGVELRKAGITAPILLLGYSSPAEAEDVVAFALTSTVCSVEQADALERAAAALDARALVHVKVNTGMNRLGVDPDETDALVEGLKRLSHVEVEGIFTHFHSSDADPVATKAQLDAFTAVLARLDEKGLRPPVAHAANSDAVVGMAETHLDMVRPGTALHGFVPGGAATLSWKTRVAHVNHLEAGETVSYGATWTAPSPRTVAAIPVGWADGMAMGDGRWQEVLVNGKRCPVVGSICMDQCMVDVTDAGPIGVGAEVVLLGTQGDARITAEEASGWLEAGHPVFLTTRISRRSPSATFDSALGRPTSDDVELRFTHAAPRARGDFVRGVP